MRLGLLPSQQRVLDQTFRKARAFERFRSRTRRHFMALGVVSVAAVVGAFFAGRSIRSTPAGAIPQTSGDKELAMLHALALGPLDQLEAAAVDLAARIELKGGDRTLWLGFERLTLLALSKKDRLGLAHSLIAVTRVQAVPDALASSVQDLRNTYK